MQNNHCCDAVEKQPDHRHMHLERRFVDVLVSMEADAELTWFFNVAPMAIDVPSTQGILLRRRHPGEPDLVEARAEAMHAARKIWGRMQQIGQRYAYVLRALYTEREWPPALEERFEHLVGVVEVNLGGLPDLAEVDAGTVFNWKRNANRACASALGAYERARGKSPSVVPQEVP